MFRKALLVVIFMLAMLMPTAVMAGGYNDPHVDSFTCVGNTITDTLKKDGWGSRMGNHETFTVKIRNTGISRRGGVFWYAGVYPTTATVIRDGYRYKYQESWTSSLFKCNDGTIEVNAKRRAYQWQSGWSGWEPQ